MVLRKNNNENQAAATPAFEDVSGIDSASGQDIGIEAVAVENKEQGQGGQTAALLKPREQTQSAALAKPASISIALASEKAAQFKKELAEMEDALDFASGSMKSYKASNGSISETGDGKGVLGAWVEGRMMAYSRYHQITPGVSGQKYKGFVGYSNDGKTISHVIGDGHERTFVGKPIQDYLDYLRTTEGFEEADSKVYMNVAMLVTASEKGQVEPGEVVNVILPPTSIRSFAAYEDKLKVAARAAAMGLPTKGLPDDPFRFRFVASLTRFNGNEWTKLDIEPATAAVAA